MAAGKAWGVGGRSATLTCGDSNDMASSSWKSPLPTEKVGLDPAKRSMGKQFPVLLTTFRERSVGIDNRCYRRQPYSSHGMDNARATDNYTACWLASEVAVCRSCIAGRLFVSEADVFDSVVDDLFQYGCDWKA